MRHPVVQATLNACALTALSNILAQLISAYRGNVYVPSLHNAIAHRHELPTQRKLLIYLTEYYTNAIIRNHTICL